MWEHHNSPVEISRWVAHICHLIRTGAPHISRLFARCGAFGFKRRPTSPSARSNRSLEPDRILHKDSIENGSSATAGAVTGAKKAVAPNPNSATASDAASMFAFLTKTPDEQSVTFGAVKTHPVDGCCSFCRVNHLADTQNRRSPRDRQQFCDVIFYCGGVNFLVRICKFYAI